MSKIVVPKLTVPKRRIILPRMVIRDRRAPPPTLKVRLRPHHLRYEVGRYRERLRSGPGGLGRSRIWVPKRVGEQHNLILDAAYDLVASYGFYKLSAYAAVGTGSTAPATTDTNLQAQVAITANVPSGESDSIARPSDGHYEITRIREFTETEVGGQNLTEWGFSPATASNFMARELFRDGAGNPITLSLATDQRLRLIYTYAIDLLPTGNAPSAFSLNLSNYGTVTGKVFFTGWIYNYASGEEDYGDLAIADNLAMGKYDGNIQLSTLFAQIKATSIITPGYNTYYGYSYYINTVPFAAYTAGSRVRTLSSQLVLDIGDFNGDNYGWSWNRYQSAYSTHYKGFAAYTFDSIFTKDNQHKVLLDPWNIIAW